MPFSARACLCHPEQLAVRCLPHLVEFDNSGVSDHPGVADLNDHYVWGYDEITWFYMQDVPRAGHGCAMPMTGCAKRSARPSRDARVRVVSLTAGGPVF